MGYKHFLLGLTLCCAMIFNAQALPDDRNQPIEIESNRVHLDDKNGVTIYEGAVKMKQGSIRINADKVVIANKGGKINKMVCIGEPAVYKQRPAQSDGLVIAKGNRIEYNIAKDSITLLDNASLEQDGGIITGERIDYDLTQEIVNAKGNAGNQRIQMVIPPQHLNKKEPDEPAPVKTKDSNTENKETP